MNSLISVLVNVLTKLKEGLDYHLIRASMVIIFFFFGYQKWFEYEARLLIPFISNWPAYFLDVSCIRGSRRQLVPGGFGVAILCPSVSGILGQEVG
jgi:hypothetical protein